MGCDQTNSFEGGEHGGVSGSGPISQILAKQNPDLKDSLRPAVKFLELKFLERKIKGCDKFRQLNVTIEESLSQGRSRCHKISVVA